MASSLVNAPRGGETGGTINRILSNSRYLNKGGGHLPATALGGHWSSAGAGTETGIIDL